MLRPLLLVFSVLVLVGCGVDSSQTAAWADETVTPPAATVVELFTSQGCSSCPPADEMLIKIHDWSTKNGQPVYCLSFHVDYWNSLGWADPYSSEKFTARQNGYARAFQSDRVYTPQMIVNGETQFVGTRGSDAVQALKTGLAGENACSINLQAALREASNQGFVEYAVTGSKPTNVLHIALVQKTVENDVPRGENSGRVLAHVNVVRTLRRESLEKPAGKVELILPEGLAADDTHVVAWVQDRKSLNILGAAAAEFGRGASSQP